MARRQAPASTSRRAAPPGPVPEKIYYKIGEAARLLGLPPYVLRYWETEFSELRPRKSGTGRRIYSRADIEVLRRLRRLLHEERFTIEGARRFLATSGGVAGETHEGAAPVPVAPAAAVVRAPVAKAIADLRTQLEDLQSMLDAGPRRGPRS